MTAARPRAPVSDKMKKRLAALLLLSCLFAVPAARAGERESAYDRVMKTKTLRALSAWPPCF